MQTLPLPTLQRTNLLSFTSLSLKINFHLKNICKFCKFFHCSFNSFNRLDLWGLPKIEKLLDPHLRCSIPLWMRIDIIIESAQKRPCVQNITWYRFCKASYSYSKPIRWTESMPDKEIWKQFSLSCQHFHNLYFQNMNTLILFFCIYFLCIYIHICIIYAIYQ